jgi:predicted MFS family arabinose efflux permease
MQRQPPGPRAHWSTRAVFFIAGFGLAAWAPLVPYAKARLAIDDAALGLLLLCLGAGSVIAMPFSGALAARFGCRRMIGTGCLVVVIALPLLATLSHAPAMALALLLFGAGIGAADVTMNIQAIIVEKAAGRALMSGFHGLFSVGGIAGAGGVSLLLWCGASPLMAAIIADLIILGVLAWSGRDLLPYGSAAERASSFFIWPHGVVLAIGLLCFICFLAEGAVLDWSALFLTSVRAMAASRSGLGYALFAVAMTIGRLAGDRVVRAIGGAWTLLFGGLTTAAGLALAVFVPAASAALAGFWMVGLGASNVVPVLYSALGRQRLMPFNLAVAAVTTMGYLGILCGPALIGFMAQATSLSVAFLCVAVLFLLIAASHRLAA